MAKKRKSRIIDNIPKYSQQPRSSPPKRRTDFSSLFCYSSSLAYRGIAASPRLSLNEVGSPKSTMSHSDNTSDELSSSSLVKYSNSEGEEQSLYSSPDEMNVVAIESVASPLSDSLLCNAIGKQKGTAEISNRIPKKSPDSESNGVSATPENEQWWSAENLEERSSNTTVEFQDQSYDKGSSSNSSRIGDNDLHLDRGRGKRERKPKVPFDEEVTFTIKSTRKLRRMRIMRYLGLAAPVGSPFSPIT